MIRQIYADGINGVTYTGGMVRVDLASVAAEQAKNGALPPLVAHDRVVMTPAAFLQAIRIMEDLMRKMTAAGVYNNKPQEVPGIDQRKNQLVDPVH